MKITKEKLKKLSEDSLADLSADDIKELISDDENFPNDEEMIRIGENDNVRK